MTREFTVLLLAVSINSSAPRAATAQLVIVSAEPRTLAVNAPSPQYPRAARMAGITGRGVAILDVDPSAGISEGSTNEP